MTAIEATAIPDLGGGLKGPQRPWRRILRNPVGLACVTFLLAVLVSGLLAPWLMPSDPDTARLELSDVGPFGAEYVLGGDQYGRDILSRLLAATTGTLQACVVLLAVSVGLGVTSGLVAGYYGGVVEDVVGWVSDVVMALPGFVLIISLYSVIGGQILWAMVLLGVLFAPVTYRLVSSLVRGVRHELYIDSARVSGLGDVRIIRRHVLRAVRGPIIIQSSFILGMGISIQAGLQFLGLGDPTEPSWGGMLDESFRNIYNNRVAVVWPALLIALTTLALILLGNVVRDTMAGSATRYGALRPAARRAVQGASARSAEPSPVAPADAERAGSLVEVRDLVLGYPDSTTTVRKVVCGVDLKIRAGEVHGLVGESGSGKSQVVASILGILPAEAVVLRGSVLHDGADLLRDPAALSAARGRKIAYVPQEPMSNLDPCFTVGQQLTYGLRAVRPVSRRQARQVLVALLDRVGIKDPNRVFDQYPHQISGGMAQRVLIAGALAGEPEVLVADEPTTALDVTVQAEVLDLLRGLQRELGLGMLLVTHDFGVVADICDRVSVMRAGVVVESRSVTDLFESPEHDYTRLLLGSMPELAGSRRPLGEQEEHS